VTRRRSQILLDNVLTDGGEVVSLTLRPILLYSHDISSHYFLLEAESTSRL
jgi:hypothetical protein